MHIEEVAWKFEARFLTTTSRNFLRAHLPTTPQPHVNSRSLKAAPAVEGDQSPDLVFPEALTLMSAQTFATPAYAGNVPSSLRSTLFPGGSRFGVEGRREHEEDQILVIGCVRRHKVGRWWFGTLLSLSALRILNHWLFPICSKSLPSLLSRGSLTTTGIRGRVR